MKVITVVSLSLLGNALVYTALQFVNGRLFGGKLAIYHTTTDNFRLIVMMPTLFLLANYIFKFTFELPGIKSSWVSASIFGTLAIVFYCDNILRGDKPGDWTSLSAISMILSSIVYGLSFR